MGTSSHDESQHRPRQRLITTSFISAMGSWNPVPMATARQSLACCIEVRHQLSLTALWRKSFPQVALLLAAPPFD
jgi:hypothetical protein